uniref:Transmembrane emp24 domain-containing protein p24beta2-like n=1 Tax=Nicotiana sylvestris TaxID=4096 RepID=A0A1U7XZE3_NICSY|nr:PREDICTED: transmembrane emp24 domain-containing protein p24beta2-like [Nicotiana sylvestris]
MMRSEVWMAVTILVVAWSFNGAFGIRFVIEKEECFSHKVEMGETVHYSFVVIKSDGSWHYSEEEGVDLVVKGPSGEQIHDLRDKISEKSEFVAHHEGIYRFCFTNKSPYHETVDFDLHAAHFVYHDEHAKDEHFKPLFVHIGKLEEALYNIQFEQHWLEAQTDRQAIGIDNSNVYTFFLYEAASTASVPICDRNRLPFPFSMALEWGNFFLSVFLLWDVYLVLRV